MTVLAVPPFVMADFLASQLNQAPKAAGRARGYGYGVLEKLIGCLARRAHLNPTLPANSDARTGASHTLPPLIHAVLQQNDLAVTALIGTGARDLAEVVPLRKCQRRPPSQVLGVQPRSFHNGR
jgi:hypothetical protein